MTFGALVVASVAAALLGASKAGVPSIGTLGIAVLALVMPPVESSGVVLPTLLVGDLVALWLYGRHGDWRVLRRLVPSVLVGLLLGYLALRVLDGATGGRLIGALIVVAGLGEALRQAGVRRAARVAAPAAVTAPAADLAVADPVVADLAAADPVVADLAAADPAAADLAAADPPGPRRPRLHDAVQHLLGAGAGLSTMVANAGGPMMTVYLLRARLSTVAFLGTTTWFFFAVNVLKVPFSVGLGLISARSLPTSAALVPGLLVGAVIGRAFAVRAPRRVFDAVALWGSTVAGVWLLLR